MKATKDMMEKELSDVIQLQWRESHCKSTEIGQGEEKEPGGGP